MTDVSGKEGSDIYIWVKQWTRLWNSCKFL